MKRALANTSNSARVAFGTGKLQGLPYALSFDDVKTLRFWKKRTSENSQLKNPVKRSRDYANRQVANLARQLTSTLKNISDGFPSMGSYHPLEREVLRLSLENGEKEYLSVLRVYDSVRKQVAALEKEYLERAGQVNNKKQAELLFEEFLPALRTIVDNNEPAIEALASMTKSLRSLPYFDLNRPVIGLVGAPNVGKSSMVRALSSGTPEVANYPFTTRGITMGHIYYRHWKYQMADLPGLLPRPDAERNRIEMLAVAVLEYTDAAVLFVTDPTGHSGTSVDHQLKLREEMWNRYPEKARSRWIDIISKADMMSDEHAALVERCLPSEAHVVSTQSGLGLEQLRDDILVLLKSLSPSDDTS